MYPDLHTVTAAVRSVLGAGVSILDRTPNSYQSSFPTEILTCRIADGGVLRLFAKHQLGDGIRAHGHSSGVEYEAAVHRSILQPAGCSVPFFHGFHADAATGTRCLLVEYLDGCLRFGKSSEATLPQAATWFGRFHALQQPRLADPALAFVRRYDAAYYQGWPERAARFATGLSDRYAWLPELTARTGEFIAVLLAAPPTIIHGEPYPLNILIRQGRMYVVDWECAAVAPGEIDLALLTDGARWSSELVRESEAAYCHARWPQGPPPDFERTLTAARLFVQFRWLGDRPEWTTADKNRWRFDRLSAAAGSLGLLPVEARR